MKSSCPDRTVSPAVAAVSMFIACQLATVKQCTYMLDRLVALQIPYFHPPHKKYLVQKAVKKKTLGHTQQFQLASQKIREQDVTWRKEANCTQHQFTTYHPYPSNASDSLPTFLEVTHQVIIHFLPAGGRCGVATTLRMRTKSCRKILLKQNYTEKINTSSHSQRIVQTWLVTGPFLLLFSLLPVRSASNSSVAFARANTMLRSLFAVRIERCMRL